ncbi:hypothetical protein IG626_02050 [Desulfovibrio desulfuricans]|uniref:hypothetical protein n=1 Tax=Desulfovibrio desulfuricans TaxID=876 RepID=UPI001781EB51|nr:hypothetical protein [Desulfovibrio desulfuricans]MBD8894772.1 hypothetical protein [Desulfovibrio desulfuricans]
MDKETLVQKIEQLSDDMELLHRAVHGSETETVLLGGVATPSYRKLVADVDARESAAAKTEIAKGVAEAQRIADTAAQTVTEAASNAVGAATQQAERAKEYADAAQASIPDNLVERVASVEGENAQQNARLDAAEQGITAISTTLIGSIMSITAAEGYVPNGTVPANGGEYTREQFREFYDTYLAGGKLLTCTYAAFTAQVALTGNCAKFALDTTSQKFKVPLLKNGDSITHAASAAELGKSVKAGLPNITGTTGGYTSILGAVPEGATGALVRTTAARGVAVGTGGIGCTELQFNAAASNPIYGNSTTVTDEQVRLRHFVVLASAQNSASVFDWSNYMAGLAGKANLDMDNLTAAGSGKIANYAMPSQRVVAVAVPASTAYTAPAPAPGWFKFSGTSSAINQYIRLSTNNFVLDELSWSSATGQVLGLIIPARKGDAVRVEYTAPTNLYMGFVFAEGGN